MAAVAREQRGMVHRSQLLDLGFGPGAIRHRIRRGSLHPVFPSVLAVGHTAPAALATETAALLYAGDDAALSHVTAGRLWGLVDWAVSQVEVTVVGAKRRHRPGLQVHRVERLDVRDVRLRFGLPVTAPARSLIDLAAVASGHALEQALVEARVNRLVTDRQLQEAIDRCPTRRGTRRMRALLRDEAAQAVTRSGGERRLRDLVQRAELPWPQFNVPLHGYVVDALWAAEKLVLEVDGYGVHGHRRAFERDRRRDQRLAAEGYVVVRVTARQLRDEPLAVVARLAQALGRRAVGRRAVGPG